jgi:hypothetical protein
MFQEKWVLEAVKTPDAPQGATEWLVPAAFVVKIQHDSKMVSWTQDVQADFISKRTDLHFNKLLDFKKSLVCTALAKKECKSFVVISNKKNIEKYRNQRLDPSNKSCDLLVPRTAPTGARYRILRKPNSAGAAGC